MRGLLLRLCTALVVLGAVVGCTDSGQEIDERKLGCAEWTDEGGGRCLRTVQEMFDDASDARRNMSPPADTSGSRDPGVTDQPNVYIARDLDCEDFNSRAEAQVYLEANPADADYLNGDGDGVPCEWAP